MPVVNFHSLKDLRPPAFKLYVFFLHLVQTQNTSVFAIPLVDLGEDSGLQPPCAYPAFRHGKDGQLRNALNELIDAGFIEKQGRRGRAPNVYTVRHYHLHTNPDAQRSPTGDELEKPSTQTRTTTHPSIVNGNFNCR